MKSATVDAASGTATVGAGLNQKLEAVTALGWAGFCTDRHRGIRRLVGATLGGGFGLLTRYLGWLRTIFSSRGGGRLFKRAEVPHRRRHHQLRSAVGAARGKTVISGS